MNERDIIQLLHVATGSKTDKLVCGIGDDCAVIEKDPDTFWLVTVDTLVEGVHFDTHWHPAEKIGRKAVSVNVSDIAAMGGKPQFVFLSLALPSGFDENWLREFSEGIAGSCCDYECILSGGDTVKSSNGIVITITVIGEVASAKVLYRRSAQPGDEIWISGYLGQASAGLELCRSRFKERILPLFEPLLEAHLNPVPRVQLGIKLAQSGLVHAMMDLSDGLATDLAHICEQSGVGALIQENMLPVSQPLQEAAQFLNVDPYRLILTGGEDYELIFTALSSSHKHLETIATETGVKLTCIGEIVEGQGVKIVSHVTGEKDQRLIDISYSGYDHFRSS